MSHDNLLNSLRETYDHAVSRLLAERTPEGYWLGRLSGSALSTATAVSALTMVSRDRFSFLIAPGVDWLLGHQNTDGGWGDTVDSPSNLATTILVQAAILISGRSDDGPGHLSRAEAWLDEHAGRSVAERNEAIARFYGRDRTFAVPILTTCALAGRAEWSDIPRLPFELACLSHRWLRRLRIHVVSYALPALIAIGQLLHQRHPTPNPLIRILRNLSINPTLRRLEAIQPSTGGFIEAVPLTSFVVLSLAAAGRADHPVADRGVEFMRQLVRDDGCWPIDSNLSVWLTTLSINALRCGPADRAVDLGAAVRWLLACQHTSVHPFTGAAPGGWGWTHLAGGVPDADDTAGALLAIGRADDPQATESWRRGLLWLMDLQNDDGGWPTFCRGWGKLPFDRSGADLTAHAVRAISCRPLQVSCPAADEAVARGLLFLSNSQRSDGSWLALWFGNQRVPGGGNPVFGTARVMAAYRDLGRTTDASAVSGLAFLLSAQNADGGWGGQAGATSSVEETAVVVDALIGWADGAETRRAIHRALGWLIERIRDGAFDNPSPIGLYFTRLWYSERVYPIIFTVAALGRALACEAAVFGSC